MINDISIGDIVGSKDNPSYGEGKVIGYVEDYLSVNFEIENLWLYPDEIVFIRHNSK